MSPRGFNITYNATRHQHRPEPAQCPTSRIPVASFQKHARARAGANDRSARIAVAAPPDPHARSRTSENACLSTGEHRYKRTAQQPPAIPPPPIPARPTRDARHHRNRITEPICRSHRLALTTGRRAMPCSGPPGGPGAERHAVGLRIRCTITRTADAAPAGGPHRFTDRRSPARRSDSPAPRAATGIAARRRQRCLASDFAKSRLEMPPGYVGKRMPRGAQPTPIENAKHWLSRRARILAQLPSVPKGAHISAALIDSQSSGGPVVMQAPNVGDTTQTPTQTRTMLYIEYTRCMLPQTCAHWRRRE